MRTRLAPSAVKMVIRAPVLVGVVIGVDHTAVVDAQLSLTVFELRLGTLLSQPPLGKRHSENTKDTQELKHRKDSSILLYSVYGHIQDDENAVFKNRETFNLFFEDHQMRT